MLVLDMLDRGFHWVHGAPPPGPPKRRSAPLAVAVVRFLATEPLVWGSCASRGRTFSQKSVDVLKRPLVWCCCAAWGSFLPELIVF